MLVEFDGFATHNDNSTEEAYDEIGQHEQSYAKYWEGRGNGRQQQHRGRSTEPANVVRNTDASVGQSKRGDHCGQVEEMDLTTFHAPCAKK
uniref:Uncharacterized protein n=1 Tax=Hyaloperonospora arabidopsidis (strain Emoy2) TaxID=559515 RepID=M4C720_HYAAE